jgi:hypothetical protein
VYSNGTVEYAVVVQEGAAGNTLWAEAKNARARYDAAVAQEKRERSAERGALFGAVLQGLAQGTAEASYEQQQVQATQDAMLAQVQQQTMQIQQAHAQAAAQQAASREQVDATAQHVAQQQVEATQQQAIDQQRQAPPATASAPVPASSAAGAPLTFILHVSLKTVINGVNATCYSNIITIPGPPGWPAMGNLPGGNMPARALIDQYKPGFEAKCREFGPLAGGGANFHWNEKGSEHISPQSMYEEGQRNRQPFVQL